MLITMLHQFIKKMSYRRLGQNGHSLRLALGCFERSPFGLLFNVCSLCSAGNILEIAMAMMFFFRDVGMKQGRYGGLLEISNG